MKGYVISYTLFTSESVCEGHPDKICDVISDAIVDEALRQDPTSKVAIETVVKDRVILVGEINSHADIDYEELVHNEIKRLGYTNNDWGFSDSSPVEVHINQQSPEIAQGVTDDHGAGDQGMMFGYASDETEHYMPLPITLAHDLTRGIDEARKSDAILYLRPDGKAQVTIRYDDDQPVSVEKVVLAVAHAEHMKLEDVKADLIEQVVKPVLSEYGLSIAPENVMVNGTGDWHIPGPASDAGLTGRKIIVDGYGGMARVGGGAFSGKDPSKVDRSGAYAARFIAKNLVARGLAKRAEVALAYVIGHPDPVMMTVETFGTATVDQKRIEQEMKAILDCSVKGIIEGLDLRRPIYKQTAAYGHFGRDGFPWEKIV